MSKLKFLTIVTVLFVLGAAPLTADDIGIQFETSSWEQVKQKAKAENKLIFVDAFATWCGPCKFMSQNVFTDEKVGDFYNKNFVNFKFDMEKGEGVDFARKYEVQAYPTLLYFNTEGELVHKIVGAQDIEDLITSGKNAKNPDTQLYTLEKKYQEGNRSATFIHQYLQALSSANQNAEIVAAEYLNTIAQSQWTKPENWAIIAAFVYDSSSGIYQYVAEHKEDFSAVNSEIQVDEYLTNGLLAELRPLVQSQDEYQLADFKSQSKKILSEAKADTLIAIAEMYFYQYDEEKGYKYMVNYFDNYCNDANQLNSIAWNFFENYPEQDKLEKALAWVNQSIDLDQNFYNLDTRANILHSLGKHQKALADAKKAVELGNAIGEDTSATEKLVTAIEENLKG